METSFREEVEEEDGCGDECLGDDADVMVPGPPFMSGDDTVPAPAPGPVPVPAPATGPGPVPMTLTASAHERRCVVVGLLQPVVAAVVVVVVVVSLLLLLLLVLLVVLVAWVCVVLMGRVRAGGEGDLEGCSGKETGRFDDDDDDDDNDEVGLSLAFIPPAPPTGRVCEEWGWWLWMAVCRVVVVVADGCGCVGGRFPV